MTEQPPELSEAELWDAIDGLAAYDTGCVGSGIHDNVLKARVKAQLAATDTEKTYPDTLARFVRDRMLNDDALAQGYGLADVAEFLRWLDDEMGIA